MIQTRTMLASADNTGAKKLMVIHCYGGSRRKFSFTGDLVKAVIKTADPHSMVKKSEMVYVVLVRARKEIRRDDGSYIRFDDNAGVIIDNLKDKNPRGTRIFGPVAREVKDRGYSKIASMAKEVV